MKMYIKISWVIGPKFSIFVAVVFFFIDSINATIRVAISPLVVEWEGRHVKK